MVDSPSDVKERVLLESQKAYIIVNAAGAIALLAFLQAIWAQPGAVLLKKGVLCGILAFAAGMAVAMLGYVARHWALKKNQLNSGFFFQLAHLWIPLLVIGCFVAGMVLPVLGALDSLPAQPERPGQVKEIPKKK